MCYACSRFVSSVRTFLHMFGVGWWEGGRPFGKVPLGFVYAWLFAQLGTSWHSVPSFDLHWGRTESLCTQPNVAAKINMSSAKHPFWFLLVGVFGRAKYLVGCVQLSGTGAEQIWSTGWSAMVESIQPFSVLISDMCVYEMKNWKKGLFSDFNFKIHPRQAIEFWKGLSSKITFLSVKFQ